jgi:hypothetical protein
MAQQRPTRSASEATVRELVEYSGYPLESGRVEMELGGIKQLLEIVREWDELPLAYRFEEGKFGNAPVEAQYWATWRSSRQAGRESR